MTEPTTQRLTELVAELERLRGAFPELDTLRDALNQVIAEKTDLEGELAQLQAEIAILRGSMARPTGDSEPGTITYDVPPNAPR